MGNSLTNSHTTGEKHHSLKRKNSMSKNKRKVSDDKRYHQKVLENNMSKSEQQQEEQIGSKQNRKDTDGEIFQQQSQNDQTVVDDRASRKKQLIGDLKQSLNSHCKLLDCLNAAMDAQRGCTELLHQYFPDNTITDTGLATGAIGRRSEDAVEVLLNLQKSCESIVEPLKKSFLTLHANIDNSLEFYGMDRIVIDKQKQSVSKITHVVEAGSSASEVRKLEEDVKQLKASSANHESKIHALQKKTEQITNELQSSRPRKAPASAATVQMFYIHGGKTIKEIEKEIQSTLCPKLRNINFKTCRSTSEIDPNKMVIVLYIVTSRVGADAANAIKNIPYLGNTILVLIHYQEVHSLSTERSADVLIDQQFKNLCGIIDLAFLTGNGFYHCEMNESGIDTLCTLCRRQRPHADRM